MAGAKPLAERGAVHVVLLLSESADVAATGRWCGEIHGHGALISGKCDNNMADGSILIIPMITNIFMTVYDHLTHSLP
jgi:hypothetical protein